MRKGERLRHIERDKEKDDQAKMRHQQANNLSKSNEQFPTISFSLVSKTNRIAHEISIMCSRQKLHQYWRRGRSIDLWNCSPIDFPSGSIDRFSMEAYSIWPNVCRRQRATLHSAHAPSLDMADIVFLFFLSLPSYSGLSICLVYVSLTNAYSVR